MIRELDRVSSKHKALLTELTIGMATVMDVAVALEETNEHDKVKKLEEAIKEFIQMEKMIQSHSAALEDVKNKARDMSAGMDEEDEETGQPFNLTQYLQERSAEKRGKEMDAANLKKHPKYREFSQKVWAVHHPDEALPDEQDEELVVMRRGASTDETTLICPITRKLLVDPLKNTICGHSYSSEAIKHHINTAPRNKKDLCPVAGCSAKVNLRSLEEDVETQHKLRTYLREQKKKKAQARKKKGEEEYTQI